MTDRDPREVYKRVCEFEKQHPGTAITPDTKVIAIELAAGLAMVAVEIRRIAEILERRWP